MKKLENLLDSEKNILRIKCEEEEDLSGISPSSTKSSKMRSPKSFKLKSPKSFIKKIRSSSSLKNLVQLNSVSDEQNGELLLTEHNINQQLGMMLDDSNKNIEKEKDLFDEINSLYSGGSIPRIKNKKLKTKKKIQNVMEIEAEAEEEEEVVSSSSSSKSKKNQLFQEYPTEEFVNRVMRIFLGGDNKINTYFQFSRKMLEERNVIEEMNTLIPELRRYYLKCKHKTYLDNLDTKKAITIFRQLIRIYGYKIKSTEKYHNGNKFLLYQLEKMKKKSPKRMNFVVDFD